VLAELDSHYEKKKAADCALASGDFDSNSLSFILDFVNSEKDDNIIDVDCEGGINDTDKGGEIIDVDNEGEVINVDKESEIILDESDDDVEPHKKGENGWRRRHHMPSANSAFRLVETTFKNSTYC